jgi:hypothetical protein
LPFSYNYYSPNSVIFQYRGVFSASAPIFPAIKVSSPALAGSAAITGGEKVEFSGKTAMKKVEFSGKTSMEKVNSLRDTGKCCTLHGRYGT